MKIPEMKLIKKYEFEPTKEDKFILWLYDHPEQHVSRPQHRLAYQFFHNEKLIFEGEDYGCSPLHAIDSDECIACLLSFLSLRPGDTDEEYFKDYTEEQLEFANTFGELISMEAMHLEMEEYLIKFYFVTSVRAESEEEAKEQAFYELKASTITDIDDIEITTKGEN